MKSLFSLLNVPHFSDDFIAYFQHHPMKKRDQLLKGSYSTILEMMKNYEASDQDALNKKHNISQFLLDPQTCNSLFDSMISEVVENGLDLTQLYPTLYPVAVEFYCENIENVENFLLNESLNKYKTKTFKICVSEFLKTKDLAFLIFLSMDLKTLQKTKENLSFPKGYNVILEKIYKEKLIDQMMIDEFWKKRQKERKKLRRNPGIFYSLKSLFEKHLF